MDLKKTAYLLIIIAAAVAFLWVAKQLLIPFVIAVLIWYVINALSHWIGKFEPVQRFLPDWSHILISGLVILVVLGFLTGLIIDNAQQMVAEGDKYQKHITDIVAKTERFMPEGYTVQPIVDAIKTNSFSELANFARSSEFSLTGAVQRLLNTLSGIAGNGLLIIIYLIFIFFEQVHFRKKIAGLFPEEQREERFLKVIENINEAVRAYFKVKITVSLITALLSYALMMFIGLDFAVLWAFLIFLLNFIPNIGSLIATIFPASLALIQFENTLAPFLVVLIGVGAIQIVVGNLVEPRMMGSSLNISSLVVILSLSIWGTLWGITGMILCVPITVIMMIIFAEFESTRPIAVLLSENGELLSDLEEIHKASDDDE